MILVSQKNTGTLSSERHSVPLPLLKREWNQRCSDNAPLALHSAPCKIDLDTLWLENYPLEAFGACSITVRAKNNNTGIQPLFVASSRSYLVVAQSKYVAYKLEVLDSSDTEMNLEVDAPQMYYQTLPISKRAQLQGPLYRSELLTQSSQKNVIGGKQNALGWLTLSLTCPRATGDGMEAIEHGRH